MREERALGAKDPSTSSGSDVSGSDKFTAETKARFDVRGSSTSSLVGLRTSLLLLQSELEQLRKKLAESEMKTARTIHDVRIRTIIDECPDS